MILDHHHHHHHHPSTMAFTSTSSLSSTSTSASASISTLVLLALTLVASILATAAIRHLLATDHDPREPPLIHSRLLPRLGHVLGIFRHGARYFAMANQPHNHPIYTLDTPGMRQYIVTSPHVAAQLQRSHRDLSFYNAITGVTRRLTGLPTSVMQKIEHNMDGHAGRDVGIMPVNHDMFANVLGRGETLRELTAEQLRRFSAELGGIDASLRRRGGGGDVVGGGDAAAATYHEVSLQSWLQTLFTDVNISSIYGPESPISLDKSLIPSFWDFEAGMLGLVVDLFPSLTMKKAYRGRERLVAALVEFIREKRYESASPMIQKRVAINLGHGMTVEEAGRSELVLWFAILGNAVPSTFWVILDIFSRPALLEEIRAELERAAVTVQPDHHDRHDDGDHPNDDKGGGGSVGTINVSHINSSCPLFVSSYRESLRLIGNLASIRYVLRDTVIGKHFLRGNSLIQVAGCIIHQDPKIWGEDSTVFNPRRFLKTASSAAASASATSTTTTSTTATATATATPPDDDLTAEESTSATQLPPGVPSAAYRLFGGGSVVCPGRHLAQSEILGFVAYLVLAFDLTDPEGNTVARPEKDVDGIPLTVLKPRGDLRVRFWRRGRGMGKEAGGGLKGQGVVGRWELVV